jgi:hypothetical protein
MVCHKDQKRRELHKEREAARLPGLRRLMDHSGRV